MSRLVQNIQFKVLDKSSSFLYLYNAVQKKPERNLLHVKANYLTSHGVSSYIIFCNNRFLGYLQSSFIPVANHDFSAFAMPYGETYALDFMMGETHSDDMEQELSIPILKEFISKISTKKNRAIALVTAPLQNNYKAIHLYERLGFAKIAKWCDAEKKMHLILRLASSWVATKNIKFEPLSRIEIPIIAEWYSNQWGYLTPAETIQNCVDELIAKVDNKYIDVVFVAKNNNEIVGTISLLTRDIENRPEICPWLSCLYVSAKHRQYGFGAWLVDKLTEHAEQSGYRSLYLFTPNKSDWYGKLGWTPVEQTFFHVEDVVIMQKNII